MLTIGMNLKPYRLPHYIFTNLKVRDGMSKLETWDKVKQIAAGAKDFEHVHEMAYLRTLILSFSWLKWEMEKKKLKNMYLSLGEHAPPATFLKLTPQICINLLHVRPHHLLHLHPPASKSKQFFSKRGACKFVTYTSPTPVTFFYLPPPPFKKIHYFSEKGRGWLNLLKIRAQHLLHFLPAPSKSYYISKKSYWYLHFWPPPPRKGR